MWGTSRCHKLCWNSFSRIDDNWGKHSMTVFFVSIFLRQDFAMSSKLALNSLRILAGLKLATILLPQTPRCWGYSHVPPYSACNSTLKFQEQGGSKQRSLSIHNPVNTVTLQTASLRWRHVDSLRGKPREKRALTH